MANKRLLSKAEAAEVLGVSVSTVERLCDQIKLEDLLVGGQVKITASSVDDLIEREKDDRRRWREKRNPTAARRTNQLPLPAIEEARRGRKEKRRAA